MTIRLVYFSRAIRDMSLQDIQDILAAARSNNASIDVCGMLCYESRWFLQALEGDRETVNELFLDIADDPRHDDIVIVSYEYIDTCIFPDWHMGYAANSGLVSQQLRAFGFSQFEPDALAPEQALNFLKMMSEQQDRDAA